MVAIRIDVGRIAGDRVVARAALVLGILVITCRRRGVVSVVPGECRRSQSRGNRRLGRRFRGGLGGLRRCEAIVIFSIVHSFVAAVMTIVTQTTSTPAVKIRGVL